MHPFDRNVHVVFDNEKGSLYEHALFSAQTESVTC